MGQRVHRSVLQVLVEADALMLGGGLGIVDVEQRAELVLTVARVQAFLA